MTNVAYTKGLFEVADDVWAYLQPDGGWGWNNAGLIAGSDRTILVDTLFDLPLTQEMLTTMSAITDTRPIETLINSHANGDHCYGNQLVDSAEIIATEKCLEEFNNIPAEMMVALMTMDYGSSLATEYVQRAFGAFDFSGIVATPPTRTFNGQLDLQVGGRVVELIEVGPAHTKGDLIVHVPDAKTVFTGDILFIEGTPILWEGELDNWTRACDTILSLDADVIVPGHGRVIDEQGPEMVKAYIDFLRQATIERFHAGMAPSDAVLDIELGEFRDWLDRERLVLNVHYVYGQLDPNYEPPPLPALIAEMANYLQQR